MTDFTKASIQHRMDVALSRKYREAMRQSDVTHAAEAAKWCVQESLERVEKAAVEAGTIGTYAEIAAIRAELLTTSDPG